jgi:hypothetical protein
MKPVAQTKNFLPSSFRLAAGGLGGAAKNERKFLWFAARGTSASRGAVSAIGAYDSVQSHHALRALLVLFKVSSSKGYDFITK